MDPSMVGLAGLGFFLLLLFLGVPIAFSFFLIGTLGCVFLQGINGLSFLGMIPFSWSVSIDLMAVPLFILMGMFASDAGIAKEAYDSAYRWFGHLRGGLAMATIAACGAFAAVCGSSMATAGTMGAVSIPEMKKLNYRPSLIGGVVAAGGTIGIMIPPSIPFVIFGMLAEESVGKLLMAGIIPGVIEVISFIFLIYILLKVNPEMAPPGPRFPWKERFASLKNVYGVLILFGVVMVGIYTGICTPTEAAAVGCFASFLLTLAKGKLSKQLLVGSLLSTLQTTGMIMFLLIGAMIFSAFMALSMLPMEFANWLTTLPLPPIVILGLILFSYIPLGMVMDSLAMIVLTVPLYLPTLRAFGYSTIWVGVLIVLEIELGLISPPVGLNLFVIKDSAKDIPLEVVYKGVIPFCIVDVVLLVVFVAFPQISLFIPNLMGK